MKRLTQLFAYCISLGSILIFQNALAEVSVWTAEPTAVITPECIAPIGGPTSLRLVAPRGGFASGQIIVKSDAPLSDLGVQVSPLNGPGPFTPSSIRISYPTRKNSLAPGEFDFGLSDHFDGLADQLIPGEKLQPVWLTVNVPENAVPGTYKGDVAIAGKKVTLELTVGEFTLRTPRQLVVATIASPDSVAMRYGVEPYSDAHFKLLERSLALQGHLGNNILFIPIISQCYLGNKFGMIQFRKNGEELTPDFTIFDRYLALYVKYCGIPRIVSVYLWEKNMNEKNETDEIEITVIGANGLDTLKLPPYPANKDAFKALLEGVVDRVRKLGLKTSDVLIGQACDVHPKPEAVAMFKEIAPQLSWSAFTHGYGYVGCNGQAGNPIGMFFHPDFTPSASKFRGGWGETTLRLDSLRCWVSNETPPINWRYTADWSCGYMKQGKCGGYGMVGLDYFQLPPKPIDPRQKKKTPKVYNLWGGPYPGLAYCRLDRGQASLITVPGPNGALSTIRLEMLAEGAEEAEARITIEKAVSNKRVDVANANALILRRGQSTLTPDWSKNPQPSPSAFEDLVAIYKMAGETQAK